MSITPLTLKMLFTLSGNQCAFPECTAPIIDTEHDVLTGQICHIRAKSPGGPRYDPRQTDEERDGYKNLLVMCPEHNKIIDDQRTREQFPPELLVEFKRQHESRSWNTVVKEDVVERIVESLQRAFPVAAAPSAPHLVLRARQLRHGWEVILLLRNEGKGSAKAPFLLIRGYEESYRVYGYGVDGNGTPGFLGPPRGVEGKRGIYFAGSASQLIHPGMEVEICVLKFIPSHDDSRPGSTLRIEYETAAEGQEKIADVVSLRLGLGGD